MAIVSVSLLATLRRTVLVKPPDIVRQLTAIPRAILTFNILNGVIAAKPDADSEELTISLILPGSFAYRWVDFVWSLTQDVAFDWNTRGYIEITNGIRNLELGATQHHAVVLDDITVVPGQSERIMARTGVDPVIRYIIQAPSINPLATPVITFKAVNQTSAIGAAGTTNFFASFFEYDLEQVEAFPVHYAALTLDR